MEAERDSDSERPDHSAADEVQEDPRLRVEGSPTRCPYCHDGVSGQQPTVVCGQCLSRHHAACWEGSCASCRSTERMVRDPVLAARELGNEQATRLGNALRRAVRPASFLVWLVTLLTVPTGLAAAFGLPQTALTHGVAKVRVWLLDESWSALPPTGSTGRRAPPRAGPARWLLLVLPALLGLSSAAAMAHSRGAPRRFALAALGLVGAALLLPAWALLTGAPFDPETVGQQRETLGWLLGAFSLPAVSAATGALFASRSPPSAHGGPGAGAGPSSFSGKGD